MSAPFLKLTNIDKAFAGVHALRDVDLEVTAQTVHAIVGENGAGKSTLGKVIAGVHEQDRGDMALDGETIRFQNPRDALAAGITIVAQEIALVGTRSVVENVFLGSEIHRGPWVNQTALRQAYDELVDRTGIEIPGRALVQDLAIAGQQKVEILRAIARRSRVIVMDEPTARLATHEARALAGIIRGLRDSGTTVLYVSHFLEEVLDVADEITVLRDGRRISTRAARAHTTGSLVEEMVGRSLDSAFPEKPRTFPTTTAPLLQVRGLEHAPHVADVSFDVSPGEIVVVTGLVGSGRSEAIRSIIGADRRSGGEVTYDGQRVRYRHPRQAIAAGIGYIPEARKSQGLMVDFSLRHNVSLPHLRRVSRGSVVSVKKEKRAVHSAVARVGVKHANDTQAISGLSGGNQQKALFAKALLGKPRLLIADEPTRGVDIQAKRQIYDLLVELASKGLGVLVVSSEMEEVIGLAHRVVVMRQGRTVGELVGDDISERNIARLAFGQDTAPNERVVSEGNDHGH